jgi:hypothetical protein
VIHNGMGYRCGYVRVPVGHSWHGKGYDDICCDCHGGLTFAEMDEPCEKPGPDDAYWVGFDTAHGGDAPDPQLPSNGERNFARMILGDEGGYGTVRTQQYAEDQCRSICEQAAKVAEL